MFAPKIYWKVLNPKKIKFYFIGNTAKGEALESVAAAEYHQRCNINAISDTTSSWARSHKTRNTAANARRKLGLLWALGVGKKSKEIASANLKIKERSDVKTR